MDCFLILISQKESTFFWLHDVCVKLDLKPFSFAYSFKGIRKFGFYYEIKIFIQFIYYPILLFYKISINKKLYNPSANWIYCLLVPA